MPAPRRIPGGGYSTGWAGFQGVAQGSPTSPKWHARRPISSRMARPAANRSVTERSFSWATASNSSIRSGSSNGMSWWRMAVTSLKTRAEWVREWAASTVGSASQRNRFKSRTKRFSSLKWAQSRTATRASWQAAEITPRSSASSAVSFSLSSTGSALQPLDVGTAGGEFLLQPLVASVEVIDAVHRGVAFRCQRGDGERYRGAQIGRHHLGAAQPGHAAHQRRFVMDGDVGAHARQLGHVHEATFETGLADHRSTKGTPHQ